MPLQLKIQSMRRTFSYSHRQTNFHTHKVWQLDIMIAGKGTVITSERRVSFETEECTILSPKTGHAFEYLEKSAFISIRFSAIQGEEYLRSAFLGLHIVKTAGESCIFRNALCTLLESRDNQSSPQKQLDEYCLSALLYSLINEKMSEQESPDHTLVDRIVDYVKANSFQALTVSAISDRFGLSLTTLYRRFRNAKGLSLKDFIIHQRIQLAKELLRSGNRPVTAIARFMHFSNVQEFSRFFKIRTGLSPREYRR